MGGSHDRANDTPGRVVSGCTEPTSPGLVSCLCVTEDRTAFMPWLLWCFARQSWTSKELVVVDSSAHPTELAPTDVRIIRVPHGTGVAEKRNMAMDHARGEFLAWFDDDDWQHPDRLRQLVSQMASDAVFVGPDTAWFMDIVERRCRRYRCADGPIFNGALFRSETARTVRFDAARVRASDTTWMLQLRDRCPRGWRILADERLFFWLCHDGNLSNRRQRQSFDRPHAALRSLLTEDAWGDTDAQLERLRARLAEQGALRLHQQTRGRVNAALPGVVGDWLRRGKRQTARSPRANARRASLVWAASHAEPTPPPILAEATVPVTAMVKATLLDASYLRVLVPHMLRQAAYPFSERMVVVDPSPEFLGKYKDRPRGSRSELDAALETLLRQGTIDRVIEVARERDAIEPVMIRFFGKAGSKIPTHATSGGPIFATLFGIEAASTDYVLQMDADIFFYAKTSWVAEALKLLTDPMVWLVMTQAGPPGGAPGTRHGLGRQNAARAEWDADRRAWRFQSASTRYFLADRRRLYGKLAALWHGGGVLPLEQCLSAALCKHGAYRMNLADGRSWDLHAYYHGAPFSEWASRIACLVERGLVPTLQRGRYDMRLDRPADREAWRALVEAVPRRATGSVQPRFEPGRVASTPSTSADADLPLAVVIAVRDRAGDRVRNALMSLRWQRPRVARQIVVVSLGSQPAVDSELRSLCQDAGAQLITVGSPQAPWCKPLALNIGIRATTESAWFVMTMDVDMILAPEFLDVVYSTLAANPRAFVMCEISDLPCGISLPDSADELERSLPALRCRCRPRGIGGTGAIQAALREFFFDVRGYDEDLKWWGAEDGDMVLRAKRSMFDITWITDRTFMLHQWHTRRYRQLVDRVSREQAAQAWLRNHRLVDERQTIVRNPGQWGGEP
jgi:glycosyltransferase involved in cell wall biosynthesis